MSKKIIQYYLLKKIFNLFVENQDQRYVLVKKNSNFPNLKTGSDLDLLVDDLSLFVRTVEDYFSKKILININKLEKSETNINLDFYYRKNLLYKLDLVSNLNNFKQLNNPSKFLDHMFENYTLFKYKFFYRKYAIKVPSESNDIIIRYLEFKKYPQKLHHYNFLKSKDSNLITQINRDYKEYLNESISF
tara:strand:+ start:249 stop:815 length:567 start_codon:yes stop_codon:yes gene_type:complete